MRSYLNHKDGKRALSPSRYWAVMETGSVNWHKITKIHWVYHEQEPFDRYSSSCHQYLGGQQSTYHKVLELWLPYSVVLNSCSSSEVLYAWAPWGSISLVSLLVGQVWVALHVLQRILMCSQDELLTGLRSWLYLLVLWNGNSPLHPAGLLGGIQPP